MRLLSNAAKLVDSRSTRSRQRKVGASEIGVCRRRAGYSHHGVKPSDPENVTGLAAIHGTWLHKGALDTMRREWGAIVETRVEDDLLRGHVDALFLTEDLLARLPAKYAHPECEDVVTVDDLKTRRDGRMVDYVRNRGPKRSELFQTHLYGSLLRRGQVAPIQRQSALADLGPIPVEKVRLRYIARTGEEDGEYVHEQPFDPDVEAEAWEWVQQVARSSTPEDLPRDEDGPGLSVICDNCPFRTACWGETGDVAPQAQLIVTDADLAATLAEYDEARTLEREAKARKDKARAMLDGTDPAIYTDGAELAFKVGWTGGKVGDPKPDVDAMIALFKEAGLPIPYLKPKASARTFQLTRWQQPDVTCGKPVGDTPKLEHGMTVWLQDRPRGGWTGYGKTDGEETGTLTAGQFAKEFPGWTEERPPCVLKKAHSGDCAPTLDVRVLDVDEGDSPAEALAAS